MQALMPSDYARLQRLAERYYATHVSTFKTAKARNPHLAVDLLCFQPFGNALCGALITPLSLSLAVVMPADAPPEAEAAQCTIALPGGYYPFVAEKVDDEHWLWRCELLDDLRHLTSMQDASRLAQHLMERVMASPKDDRSNAHNKTEANHNPPR